MKETLIILFFVTLVVGGAIYTADHITNSIPEPKFKMVKRGEIERVEYLSTSGSFSTRSSKNTVLYFTDGAVINICVHHDIYNKSCVEIFKVKNRVCAWDNIQDCNINLKEENYEKEL